MNTQLLFYWVLTLSLIGNIIDSTFIPKISQKKPLMGIICYRNTFLLLLLLPLFIILHLQSSELAEIPSFTIKNITIFIGLGFVGAATFFSRTKATHYMPIAVVGVLTRCAHMITLVFIPMLFGDILSVKWYIGAVILFIAFSILSYTKNSHKITLKHENQQWKGLLFSFISIPWQVIWFLSVMYLAKGSAPFFFIMTAEFSVLIWYTIFAIILGKSTGKAQFMIFKNFKELGYFIMMCIFPTINAIGFSYTTRIGNANIATLVMASSSMFIAIIWALVYKENLTFIQWSMVCIAAIGLYMINI